MEGTKKTLSSHGNVSCSCHDIAIKQQQSLTHQNSSLGIKQQHSLTHQNSSLGIKQQQSLTHQNSSLGVEQQSFAPLLTKL